MKSERAYSDMEATSASLGKTAARWPERLAVLQFQQSGVKRTVDRSISGEVLVCWLLGHAHQWGQSQDLQQGDEAADPQHN